MKSINKLKISEDRNLTDNEMNVLYGGCSTGRCEAQCDQLGQCDKDCAGYDWDEDFLHLNWEYAVQVGNLPY